jgi:hypothetical protein
MSLREKSAWAMGTLILVTGLLWVLHMDWAVSDDHVHIFDIAHFFIAVIILSIIIQGVLAVTNRGEAGKPADERERVAIWRAGHWSGTVLGVGVILSALTYGLHGGGASNLFNGVVASLIAAQFAEYAFQILFLRKGV